MPFDSLDLCRDKVFPSMALEPTVCSEAETTSGCAKSEPTTPTPSACPRSGWHPSHSYVLSATFLSPHLLIPRIGKFEQPSKGQLETL